VKRIALGSLRPGYTFGFEQLSIFSVDSDEVKYNEVKYDEASSGSMPPSFLRRVVRKIRAFLKGND